MRKLVAIWRESVYKNDFTCQCGNKLMVNGEIDEAVLMDDENYLYCPKCKSCFGVIREQEMPEEVHGLMGDYNQYMNRKRS